ncbi:nose resistant to fluoxetine protein 6-like [Galleria mellonella]|uniref:Nose resistant to fluoxetine protein 6-like n=1 Tax=Galleria mellonella TaxID=7137 RepID=A0ABM3MJX1_GALME|nr:nose resistant to fluoxetine protein 6-like [Galleria mellonella]
MTAVRIMARALTTAALAALLCVCAAEDVLYEISDDLYYQMPPLFHLDDYKQCLGTHGVYCLGSFELSAEPQHQLFQIMQRYSANWVDNFNHTRLHRGLCVSRRCPRDTSALYQRAHNDSHHTESLDTWFESCVNASTMSAYNLSARLYQLEYCRRGAGGADPPLTYNERAFAGALAAVLALAAISTVLDATLSDDTKKGAPWAVAWSAAACWRALGAAAAARRGSALAAMDGLRVLGMMCFIIEHVCWLNSLSYLVDTRRFERDRLADDVVLMTNGTLVVQVFFVMSSFLLAHKLLEQRRREQHVPKIATFVRTMFNRIIRMSPSYFFVVWFAASWWQRTGDGPMWEPLVGTESAICRHKWWTQLLYLNNVIYPDEKCLIQTWYLAADMQLYALSLVLTLALWRLRLGAVYVLGALMLLSVATNFTLAYLWRLVPTFILHRPESVRVVYRGEASFNVLYQSPLGNLPGALAGLLLAHLHHALLQRGVPLNDYKVFRWASVAATPLAALWVGASPRLLRGRPPPRAAAAALAAVERPVFVLLVVLAMLGAINGVRSPVRSVLAWRGWATCAQLSFGVLMLHMIINKSLVAARLAPTQLDRLTAILEWFGVAFVSYLAALLLALLVELPTQRLHRALSQPPPPAPAAHKKDAAQ